MKAVLVNMGFDPVPAMDSITYFNLDRGDSMVLIFPQSRDEGAATRSEQARAQVKSHVAALKAAGRAVELKELPLDLGKPGVAFGQVVRAAKAYKDRQAQVILELSGGVRMLTSLMTMMALLCPGLIDQITMLNEVTRERLLLPISGLTALPHNTKIRRVLAFIAERGNVKRAEIADALDLSLPSVSRVLSKLKHIGLIEERLRVITISATYSSLAPLFSSLTQ